MKLKRFMTITISLAMLMSASAVLADDVTVADEAIVAVEESVEVSETTEVEASLTIVTAGVSEVGEESIIIGEGEDAYELLISDATIFVNQNAEPITRDEITTDCGVAALVDGAMTKSIPPQTNAYIITKITDVNAPNPIYAEIADVEFADGIYSIATADGEYILHISDETEITPLATKNIIKAVDLKKGDKILFLADAIMQSLPAQATPTKVVVLEQSEEEVEVQLPDEIKPVVLTAEELATVDAIKVNDKDVDLSDLPTAPYVKGDALMVPLRKIGEALGFVVDWDATTGFITLSSDKAELGIDTELDDNTDEDPAKPYKIVEGTTFVPHTFFENTFSIDGTTLVIK